MLFQQEKKQFSAGDFSLPEQEFVRPFFQADSSIFQARQKVVHTFFLWIRAIHHFSNIYNCYIAAIYIIAREVKFKYVQITD